MSKDLVHENSTTTGTGNLTLAAVNGKVRFSNSTYGFGTGATTNVFVYYASNRAAAEWEIGAGHMSDANTLVRDTIYLSSNSNAAVSFSAGTKDVTNDVPSWVQDAALLKTNNLSDLTSAATALTNLGGTTVGKAVFTAANAAAARSTLGSTTVGDAVFVAASQAAAQTALGVTPGPPIPIGSSGVGQWTSATGATNGSYSLPSGGTWAYFMFPNDGAAAATALWCDVAAGGTSIIGNQGYRTRGFIWRIA